MKEAYEYANELGKQGKLMASVVSQSQGKLLWICFQKNKTMAISRRNGLGALLSRSERQREA